MKDFKSRGVDLVHFLAACNLSQKEFVDKAACLSRAFKNMANARNYFQNTLRALWARSGNRCFFEACDALLIEDDDLVVGEICHINAVSPNGPRYDQGRTVDYLRSPQNLLFLCSRHHKRIDTFPEEYTVRRLKEMKSKHETRFRSSHVIDEGLIDKIQRKFEADQLADMFFVFPELRTLARCLQQWKWAESDLPREVILDSAAWLAYATVDGADWIFPVDSRTGRVQSDDPHSQFWSWTKSAKRSVRFGGDGELDGSWISRYRLLIEKILEKIRYGDAF